MSEVELHAHTNISDSDLYVSPEQIVLLAKEEGLKALAITDHDTVRGIDLVKGFAKNLDLEIIPGIELSTLYGDRVIHVLGYFIDYKNPILIRALENQLKARNLRSKLTVGKFNEKGADIDFDSIKSSIPSDYVADYHIANVLMKKGFVDSILEGILLTKNGAYAYVPYRGLAYKFLTFEEAIHLLTGVGAFISIAHPGNYNLDSEEAVTFFKKAKSLGVHAIEAISRRHSNKQTKHFNVVAKRFGFLITGGTDFHGFEDGKIGSWDGSINVDYSVVEKMKEVLKK